MWHNTDLSVSPVFSCCALTYSSSSFPWQPRTTDVSPLHALSSSVSHLRTSSSSRSSGFPAQQVRACASWLSVSRLATWNAPPMTSPFAWRVLISCGFGDVLFLCWFSGLRFDDEQQRGRTRSAWELVRCKRWAKASKCTRKTDTKKHVEFYQSPSHPFSILPYQPRSMCCLVPHLCSCVWDRVSRLDGFESNESGATDVTSSSSTAGAQEEVGDDVMASSSSGGSGRRNSSKTRTRNDDATLT